jgi:hypothetical protein
MTARSKGLRVMKGIASSLIAAACLSGCSNVQGPHTGKNFGGAEPRDALTVVLDYAGGSPDDAVKLEARLSECIQKALYEAGRALKLIPSDEFRRLVFPDLDITSVPRSTESLGLLLKVPQFQQKIHSLRLRFLVTVKKEETSSRSDGIVGPYVILVTHEKRFDLVAHIIDMKSVSETGVVSTTEESKGLYGLLGILPIIIPPMTEPTACQHFGREVVNYISNKTE